MGIAMSLNTLAHDLLFVNLDHALEYRARGWAPLALHSPTENGCTCGKPDCRNPGKHPRLGHWPRFKPSEATIQKWWTGWPTANVGILAGLSGLLVIDVDERHGGSLSLLEELTGALPTTPIAQSGRGNGGHVFFKAPTVPVGNSRGQLPSGFDIRGKRGLLVAAPSVHATGGRYRWLVSPDETEVAAAPAALLRLLTCRPAAEHERTAVRSARHVLDVPTPDGVAGYLLSQALEAVTYGHRNDDGFRLARQLRDHGFTQDEAYPVLGLSMITLIWLWHKEGAVP